MTNEKIKEILDRCKGRFGWVQIHIDTEENYLLMPLTDLVELLEKQIPKKPVNYDSVPHSRCPVCNNAVKVLRTHTNIIIACIADRLWIGVMKIKPEEAIEAITGIREGVFINTLFHFSKTFCKIL